MGAKKAMNKMTEQTRRRLSPCDPVTNQPAPHAAPYRSHLSSPRPYRNISSSSSHISAFHSISDTQTPDLDCVPRMQDRKVLAHHEKWGTFQVPKAFLCTNNDSPAAVASVRQARRACSLLC